MPISPDGVQSEGASVRPRYVFHCSAPVDAFTAYSYPSQEPKYAVPPVTVGVEATGPPVWNDHSLVSVGAVAGEMFVSLDAAVRSTSCSDVVQVSLTVCEPWASVVGALQPDIATRLKSTTTDFVILRRNTAFTSETDFGT